MLKKKTTRQPQSLSDLEKEKASLQRKLTALRKKLAAFHGDAAESADMDRAAEPKDHAQSHSNFSEYRPKNCRAGGACRDHTECREHLHDLAKLSQLAQSYELLSTTAAELLKHDDPVKAINIVCRKVMEHLDCQVCFNFLVVDAVGRLRLNSSLGVPEKDLKQIEWLDFGESLCGQVAREGRTVVVDNILNDPNEQTKLAASYGIQAYACHPLLGPGGAVTGTLSFGTRMRQSFSAEDVAFMKAVADQVAVVVMRKRSRDALGASESRFRSLFDRMTEGFALHEIVCDQKGAPCDYRFLEINSAFEKLTGLKREEITGKLMSQVLPNEDLSWVSLFGEVALTGRPAYFDKYSQVLKRYYQVWAYCPDLGQFAVLFSDITERKQMEQELLESKDRLELAQRMSGVGTWDWDMPSGELKWSKEMFDIFGVDPQKSTPCFDLWKATLHPEDRDQAQRLIDEAIKNHAHLDNEYRIILPDGRIRWISALGKCSYDSQDRPVRMTGIAMDVTARKEAEEALAKSERLYRAIGESIDYGVWVCTPDGRNIYASESFLKMVGLTQQQCSDFGWGDVLHPDDTARTIAAWKECVRSGGNWDIEHRFRGVDGAWHPVLARGMPVHGENGQIIYWAGINLDISGLKEAEDALKEADRRKDQFLAVLGHELRNPLTAINSGIRLLKGPVDPERHQFIIRAMEQEAGHLRRLLDDLLDLSRISRGKIPLQLEEVLLSALVHQAVESVRREAEEKKHRLSVILPSGPVYLRGDRLRLEQILANLLANAVKYTNAGGRIDLCASLDNGHLCLKVKDNGVGIPSDKHEYIFQMFGQLDNSLSRTQNGLGIGLNLVRALTALHGGTISVQSEGLGCGSEFTLRLPYRREPVPINPEASSSVCTPSVEPGLKILIVDDQHDVATLMALDLEGHGHNVTIAHDGFAALEHAAALRPDAVILDIGLPGMDGHEVARQLRGKCGLKSCLIVAASGYGQPEDRARSLGAGCDYHLVKPVEYETLAPLFAQWQWQQLSSAKSQTSKCH